MGDAGTQRRDLVDEGLGSAPHLRLGEARRDVLRAVPVEADDVDQEGTFRLGSIVGRHERGDVRWILAGMSMADDLEAAAVRIVHEE